MANAMNFDFNYWGSWGISDWYDEAYKALKAALESGKPFNTGWHGWKKNEDSMQIIRTEQALVVNVGSCMDEAYEEDDLIRDCLTEEEEELLTDEMVERIRELLYACTFNDETEDSETLPVTATIEEIEAAAGRLVDKCFSVLKEHFRECIWATLVVMYGESEETEKLIEERIARLIPEN